MKQKPTLFGNFFSKLAAKKHLATYIALVLFLCVSIPSMATTKSAIVTGNWSAPATWSPAGVPASTDDVIIKGGFVVTVDGAYTCAGLDVGDATGATTTLKVTLAANSLRVNGDLRINPNNKANNYLLDAGPGAINIAGTFSTWGTAGTNGITASTGTLTFAPAVTISNALQNITLSGAATVNFSSTFTDNYNKLVPGTTSIINFAGNYVVGTTTATWGGKGTANFTNAAAGITANANLTMFNITTGASSGLTLNSGSGALTMAGALTLGASSAFTVNQPFVLTGGLTLGASSTLTANQNFEVDGSWTNNGGTLSGTTETITFNGAAPVIGGTSTTAFQTVQLGNTGGAGAVALALNNNSTFTNLIFSAANVARTLTPAAGITVTVNGDLTMNQPTAAVSNTLALGALTGVVHGNLIFVGTNNTATQACKITVSTGSFTLDGTVTWMANTAIATELIQSTGTGSITFGSPLVMGSGSGTLSLTSTGTLNFNGSSPSLTFGDAVNSPSLATVAGSFINLKYGFVNNGSLLALNATSTTTMTNNGSISPNAAITFGHLKLSGVDSIKNGAAIIVAGTVTLNASSSLAALQSFEVDGSWTNNGGSLSGIDTITFNSAAPIIGGTSTTAFQSVQLGNTGGAVAVALALNNNSTFTNLIFSPSTLARTLTPAAGVTVTVNGDLTMNQPTAAVANTLALGALTGVVHGNLIFTGTNNTASQLCKISVSTGSFTLDGAITWMANTASATEVITSTGTGSITFGSPIVMGNGSGTIALTSTGTVNFNGSSPSLTFGDAINPPSFTTVAGSFINLKYGFVNNGSLQTFNATSTTTLTNNGAILPNAPITFGHLKFSGIDSIKAGGNAIIVAGTVTLNAASSLNALQSFEVDGNWTNNGGTLTGTNDTITLNGAASTINGTSVTTFQSLQIGTNGGATAIACALSNNSTFTNLIFSASTVARTLTPAAGVTVTVNGDLTMNQPTAAVANTLALGALTGVVHGNLIFTGVNNTATQLCKISVSTGSFTLDGTITWMANTAIATEVITSTGTGSLNFGSPIVMGSGSGTIALASNGTANFNGSSPSLTFGDAVNAPAFTTVANSNINFKYGFVNNGTAQVFNATSTTTLTNNGSITSNANITFGHLKISGTDSIKSTGNNVVVAGIFTLNNGSSLKALQSFEVDGNWVNNGGTLTGTSDTVFLNGAAPNIGGTSTTNFQTLQLGTVAGAGNVAAILSNNSTFSNLIFSANTAGKLRTLTLSAGVNSSVSGNLTMNQPAAIGTNNLLINAAIFAVHGNLIFVGTNATTTYVDKITTTTGAFTLDGTITWMANTAVATEILTVTTGSMTFNSPIVMGSNSGTISLLNSGGSANFNGSNPSLTFGGVATVPSLTTVNGSILNIKNGLVNNTNALAFTTGTNVNLTASTSVTPNANITFGNLTLGAGLTDTINAGAGIVAVAGTFTLSNASVIKANQNLEINGAWVNNGGTVNTTPYAIVLNGTVGTIGGTAATAFQTLQVGNNTTSVTAAATINTNNNSCTALVFSGDAKARTLTIAAGMSFPVNGDVTINQPTAAVTNTYAINAGTSTVSGNLNYVGATSAANQIGRLAVTTGAFTLNGNVNWMSNTSVASEVIALTGTGSLTFANSLSMPSGSGTLSSSSTGTINFNGSSAPSFNFGGATAPSFSVVSGSLVKLMNGITNNNAASLTFATGSTTEFIGNGTITSGAGITLGNVIIDASKTLTLAGNVSVKNDFTDNGTFAPSTYTVTFNAASPNVQTITRAGGETFYGLTATNAGATLLMANDLTITGALTMSGPNINMNGKTLNLGTGAGASLTRTAGIAYGGTWIRYLPAGPITSAGAPNYGLFPIGISTAYRPLAITSTTSPTTGGYITATHTDANSVTVTNYLDNEGTTIQDIADMKSTMLVTGLAGGTYKLAQTFTGLASAGSTSDLKMETYTGGVMGSCGITVATTGTVSSPITSRSNLSEAMLNNVFVVGSKNISVTPMQNFYYSRKTGNWSDVTSGNSTWSFTSGGSGTSCNCTPTSTGYVVVSPGQTVTADVNATSDYIDVSAGGQLSINSGITLTSNKDVTMITSGGFANAGTWNIAGNQVLAASTVSTASGAMTVTGNFTLPSGASYTQSAGSLTLNGDVTMQGTMDIGSATTTIGGTGVNFTTTGSITGTSGNTITISNNRILPMGSTLTLGTALAPINLAISGATTTITNRGTIKVYGNITGSVAGSTWTNMANSSVEALGSFLTTGTLTATAIPNTVKYTGSGSQTIIAPATGYYNLIADNSGTKTLAGNVTVSNALTIGGAAILDESTYAINGAADLNMTGTSELKMQRSVGGTYPELTGTLTLTSGTVTINQTGGTDTLAATSFYNLKLDGSRPHDISWVSAVRHDLSVLGSSSVINSNALAVTGVLNYSSTGSTTLSNDITASGVTISAGALNDGGNDININGAGGFMHNGGTVTATGTIHFLGNTAQQLGGSLPTIFNNMEVNNTAGVTLNVSPAAPTVITSALTLNNGVLTTTTSNILRMLNGSTAASGSATSYVSGPMVKVGNDDFIFPLGKGGKWRRAGISDLTDSTSEVTAEYFPTPYGHSTSLDGTLQKISNSEYWLIDRAVSSDSLRLKLFWEAAYQSSIQDCGNLTIAHYTGGQWNNEEAKATGGSNCMNMGSGSIITTGYITSFSPFTFGSKDLSALPIELVSFTALPVSGTVETHWTTAQEINNAFFTVEKSTDATNFIEVGKVDGAGNTTTSRNYELTDATPAAGLSYYRLRQTDFDGKFTYSNVVAVKMGEEQQTGYTLYPNPSNGQVFLNVQNPGEQVQVDIYDVVGDRVFSHNYSGNNSGSTQTINVATSNMLSAGVYIVAANSAGKEFKEKLIIH